MPSAPVNSSLDWASLLSPMAGCAVQKPQVPALCSHLPFLQVDPSESMCLFRGPHRIVPDGRIHETVQQLRAATLCQEAGRLQAISLVP